MIDLEELNDTERMILIERAKDLGATNTQIAERLGMNRSSVWKAASKDPLKSAIEELFAEVLEAARAELMAAAHKAVKRLVQIVDEGETDRDRRMAARDILVILQRRGDDRPDEGEEIWEAEIKGKQVHVRKVDRPALPSGEEDETN